MGRFVGTALPRSLLARFRAVLLPNAMRAESVKAKEVTGTIAIRRAKRLHLKRKLL